MVVRVEKEEALASLARHREEIGAKEGSCVMCLLAQGRAYPAPIFETQDAVVLLDRYGSRKGHLLVISKEHVEDFTDLSQHQYLEFQKLAYQASQALNAALSPERVFTASLGAPKAVPMSFPHFHLHVIPIFESDERARPARVFSWTDGVVLYDDAQAEELAERISASWPSERKLRLVGTRGALW